MNADQFARLLFDLRNTPWAMVPEWITTLVSWAHSRAPGGLPAAAEGAVKRFDARVDRVGSTSPGVAVVPIVGIISYRGDFMDALFGGGSVSIVKLTAQMRQLAADPSVGTIILDVDSPGGTPYGLEELDDVITGMRQKKRVVAVANPMMASAAYWIASAASEVIATPEAQVGSIGVWTAHISAAEFFKSSGLDVTLISAGKYKVEGNQFEPLGKDARSFLQSQVDKYYGMFVDAVARNRRTTPAAVKSGYGEGRSLIAADALRANLIDRVSTIENVMARESRQQRLARAEARVSSVTSGRLRTDAQRRMDLIRIQREDEITKRDLGLGEA